MKKIWKVLPRIPHTNLETMLNRLDRDGWEVYQLLPAGSAGEEHLVTVVTSKAVGEPEG